MDDIRTNLSPQEWEGFRKGLSELAPEFGEASTYDELAGAVDKLIGIFGEYPYTRRVIAGVPSQAVIPPPSGEERELRELANRLQKAIQKLSEEGKGG
ncbi:MAG TPA: hypothetical protein EYP17_05500 [Candidatus Latescibacteria bacterium]|nr:hypothetical protein [Candidatus Latescibacterota bacterium]